MPKKLNTGESRLDKRLDSPLASKSSVKRNIASKYGNRESANGIAFFAPLTNVSYGLTFLTAE